MTKPIKVGVYRLGLIDVGLYLRDGTGGSFSYASRDGAPYMEVGTDQGWSQAHAALHHEVYEMGYVLNGLRYAATVDYASDTGAYLFSMNHTQFSEANAQAAGFLLKAIPAFKKAFSKKR